MKRSPVRRDPKSHLHLQEIRRALRPAERAMSELARIQKMIPLPSPEDLDRMISGEMPLSEEAYVLTILQHAVLNLEKGTLDVRVLLHIENFRKPKHRTQRRGRDFDLASGLEGVITSRKG
jgi:hypothetical protein